MKIIEVSWITLENLNKLIAKGYMVRIVGNPSTKKGK